MNLSFSIIVFCTLLNNIFTITNPEMSSTNGASIFINSRSFGFKTICSFGEERNQSVQKNKQDS